MHCGPPNQNFGWVMTHVALLAAPRMVLEVYGVAPPVHYAALFHRDVQ